MGVLPQLDISQVGQVALPSLLHRIQRTEKWQGKARVGEPILAAAHHIHTPADPVLAAAAASSHRSRTPRGSTGSPTAVAILQPRLEPVALVAERLELLDLPAEGGAPAPRHRTRRCRAHRWAHRTACRRARICSRCCGTSRCARSRCRKTSLVAPASLWRYFSPKRSSHACSTSASSGSSQITQSASPARSRKLRHSHKLRMATLGQCPAASSAPRAARRSRVQKWPRPELAVPSRQLPNSGTADSRPSDLWRGRALRIVALENAARTCRRTRNPHGFRYQEGHQNLAQPALGPSQTMRRKGDRCEAFAEASTRGRPARHHQRPPQPAVPAPAVQHAPAAVRRDCASCAASVHMSPA